LDSVSEHRAGLVAGLLSYVIWGLFPLFWPLVESAGTVEILAHRIIWSLAFLAIVLALTAGFGWVRTLGRRRLVQLCAAAALITVNWGVFIYAVNSDHVVDSALGYYINPLVSVALGILVLHEHLRPRQRWAVALGALAVLVLTIEYGQPPWIAMTLACSFGVYGLVKKQVGLEGTQSLAVETTLLALPALAYVVVLQRSGDATFVSEGAGHALLLVAGGVVTALPLMLFGAAAIRVPLVTIGLIQYIAPTMHFIIGVAIYGEAMPPGRVAGFVIVWAALVLLTIDALGTLRGRVPAPPHPAASVVRPAAPPEA
jgi:chloramphenicol-sensitive protein RarD